MTRKVVAKFGGTSVKTASAIQCIADIVRANGNIKVVVVSAVGGMTDLLVDLCYAEESQKSLLIQSIKEVHLALAKDLDLDLDKDGTRIVSMIDQLQNIKMVRGDAEKIDQVLAFGEELSSVIVQAFLEKKGIRSELFDARTFMVTDNQFGRANVDCAALKTLVEKFPEALVVTQGFIGATLDGKTTTLGRGGSDYSAALIAESLSADELLIYTDVPGVYTMDPNIVPEASLIKQLSFQEMAEMANFGAKILHPATLEPCLRSNVLVKILSTFESCKEGTAITFSKNSDSSSTPRVIAVTMRKNQLLVTIKSLKMLNAYGFLASIFSILAEYSISVDLITTSEVSIALTIDGTSLGSHGLNPFLHNKELMNKLEQVAEIKIEEDLILLAVIGSGLMISGVIQKTLSIIKPYKIRLVCYGASNSSIGILVHKKDAISVAKVLHQELLEVKVNHNTELR